MAPSQSDPSTNPEVRELKSEVQSLVTTANNYAVTTAAQYSTAGEDLKRVKGLRNRLETARKSMTQPLDAAKNAIMSFFRDPTDQLDRAENLIKRAMIGFQNEQDRLRREEQARADEEARKQQEKLQARAATAAEKGQVEKAADLELRAATTVAPVIHREAPKVVGVSTREAWKFEVTDPALVPREFLSVDETKIRKVVSALKGDAKIAGVRVYSEKVLAAGAA